MITNFYRPYFQKEVVFTLVFAFYSGLPLPLSSGTLQAWMTKEAIDLKTIGLFSLVGLPYGLKFLWAPVFDRFSLPFLNRRTAWIFLSQFLIVLTLFGMAFITPSKNIELFAFFALVLAFFSATQDIVIDAYRTELLTPDTMAAGSSATVLGGRIALLVSGALAIMASDFISFSRIYLIIAGVMGLGLIASACGPVQTPAEVPTKRLFGSVIAAVRAFTSRQGAFLLVSFIVTFKLGDAIAGALMTPFLLKIGFSGVEIGSLNKFVGSALTIVGAVFGGVLVSKKGIWWALFFSGILQAISNWSFVWLANVGKSLPILVMSIGIENLCGGMGTAAFLACLTTMTDRRFTATQFSIFTSLMAITRIASGAASGFLVDRLGWAQYFFLSVFFAIPGLLLLWAIRQRRINFSV